MSAWQHARHSSPPWPDSGIIVSVTSAESPVEDLSGPGSELPSTGSAFPSRQPLVGMSKEELASWLRALGEPTYRGRQIAGWLYDRGARDFAEMTDLPTALRRQLAERAATGRA